jgi:hypothetical protein
MAREYDLKDSPFYQMGLNDGLDGPDSLTSGERVFKSKAAAEEYAIGLADGKGLKRSEEAWNKPKTPEDEGYRDREIMQGYLQAYSEEHIRRYGGPS